jgi:pantetheine-phosphate adenylyltransferase
MKQALYPGTFDPITLGHLDIIKRAQKIFDNVVVAVVKKPSKKPLFAYSKRVLLARQATASLKNVVVEGFDGLIVDFAREKKINVILRGLRLLTDFEYEFQMALTNRKLDPRIETIFLMPHPQYFYVSSRLLKEAARFGADLKQLMPEVSLKALREKLRV